MQIFRLRQSQKSPTIAALLPKILLVFLAALTLPLTVKAATLLSQSYSADKALPVGSIVSLEKGSTDHVTASSAKNSNYILGVVVNANNSQLSISSGKTNQVNVAADGIQQVLISDINGKTEVGDSVTASPIEGVGMKATASVKVIGVAQDSFPNNTASEASYKDSKGEHKVKVGEIPISVNVAYYYKQPEKSIIPQSIQNLANALAGKKVNPLPIIISMGIFIVTMIVVVSIVYSMIHSSIISVGRNPMSQAAVYRNVIQLSVLVVVILGVAVGAIFLVLTKF
jgi:hypothetical protein